MNPELLKGNNVELGVLEVSGDGLDALRPIPGDILKTPESFSALCGNSKVRYTCQQLRVKTLMCVSVGNMSCKVAVRVQSWLDAGSCPGDAEQLEATRKPRAVFRRRQPRVPSHTHCTSPSLPWPTSPKKSTCLANYLARKKKKHADKRVMSKIVSRSRRARRTTSLACTILHTTPQRASMICRISIVPTRP